MSAGVIPNLTIFGVPKYAPHLYGIWPYLGTYLGVPNMVNWGVPEKILQNEAQTCWSTFCIRAQPKHVLFFWTKS